MTEYNAKIQEMERRLAAAEEELRALKARDNKDDLPEPPHPKPKLKQGERYYCTENNGDTHSYAWWNTVWDSERLAIGNVFRTVGAANYAAEYLRVLAEMREWAGTWNDPWYLRYDGNEIVACQRFVLTLSLGEIRFATEADAKNCIKAVSEDRLKKYYFCVPEENGCAHQRSDHEDFHGGEY